MDEIKAGDIVRLKSDGDRASPMTVESVQLGVVSLVWRDMNGTMHRMPLSPDAVKHHEAAAV